MRTITVGVGVVFAALAMFQGANARDVKSVTVAGIAAYNHGDYEGAFRLLKSAADAGDSDAEVDLGYMYARGQAVTADQAEAMHLYQRSADQGNGEGMNAIAYKYTFGTGVSVDIKKAVEWYCRAIEIGNPRALTNLGSLHATGNGVSFDLNEARELWRQAAKMGHANAMYDLGVSLLQHPAGARDQAEGNTWLVHAAQQGQPGAIGWLRASGYAGALPEPVDTVGMMELAPPKASPGYAPECASA